MVLMLNGLVQSIGDARSKEPVSVTPAVVAVILPLVNLRPADLVVKSDGIRYVLLTPLNVGVARAVVVPLATELLGNVSSALVCTLVTPVVGTELIENCES